MTVRDPIEPVSANTDGGKLRGPALTYAKWAIYAAALVLLCLVLSVHLNLGTPELFVKFALLFVIFWGPSLLIGYLETGNYFRH